MLVDEAGFKANRSVLGRLLEELSWEGPRVRQYRFGGRGLENVLAAEVLTALDFLPRRTFLGAVLAAAHGADTVRGVLVDEIEAAAVTFLPGQLTLPADAASGHRPVAVQPDAMITNPSCQVLVEAKRLRRSAFQPTQLACQYLVLTHTAAERTPLLLLLLAAAPPIAVAGQGRLHVDEAIGRPLPSIYPRVADHPRSLPDLLDRIPASCAWITWTDLAHIVAEQASRNPTADPSVRACIDRLATSLSRAVARHA